MHLPHPTSIRRRPLPDTDWRRPAIALIAAGLAASALVCVAAASAGTSTTKTRVTVIGDSVMASFDYVPAARRYLGRGFDIRSDAVVCRRLVAASCAFQGATPTTALELIGA